MLKDDEILKAERRLQAGESLDPHHMKRLVSELLKERQRRLAYEKLATEQCQRAREYMERLLVTEELLMDLSMELESYKPHKKNEGALT